MKIKVENLWGKKYIEVLPSLSVRWSYFYVYFGWLFWTISIWKK